MSPKRLRTATVAALVALAACLSACGRGGDVALAEPAVRHPLAQALDDVRKYCAPLGESDSEDFTSFVRYAEPSTSSYEVRRACGLAGRALRDAPPAALAGFVAASATWLTDNFFAELPDATLAAVAGLLGERSEVGEVERLRMETVLSRGKAVYNGSLRDALSLVPFAEAVAPRPLPLRKLLPPAGADVGTVVGALEILRLDAFVAEGNQRDLTMELYRKALSRWPGDAALISGVVAFCLENGERYEDDLDGLIEKADGVDPSNAAWLYLRAARLFRRGQDAPALEALRLAKDRRVLTFHSLERARRVSAWLETLGYGPLRARLTAHRAVSVASWFELKDLANRAVSRSYEYEQAGREDDLRLVLELPRVMDRQIRPMPRVLFAESLRGTILATGLERFAEQQKSANAPLAFGLAAEARQADARVAALEAASATWSGQEAWSRLYGALGDEKFRRYVDGVVYGNEAEFILLAAQATEFNEVLVLTQRSFGFD